MVGGKICRGKILPIEEFCGAKERNCRVDHIATKEHKKNSGFADIYNDELRKLGCQGLSVKS